MKKLISLIAISALTLGLLTSCSSSTTSKETTTQSSKVEEIKKNGKLTIYTNAEFPPYEFLQGDKIVGVDIDIMQNVADKLGVTLDINNTEFGGICAAIGSGKGDVGASGITILDERKEQVDFSTPYVDSVQYLIVNNDSTIANVEDLKGKSIGGQTGTTGAMLLADDISTGVLKDSDATLREYNSAPSACQDLISGRVEAVVIDELVAISIANSNDAFTAIPLTYESGDPVTEQFGMAVAKGNDDLLQVINDVINEMTADGSIKELTEKYSQLAQ